MDTICLYNSLSCDYQTFRGELVFTDIIEVLEIVIEVISDGDIHGIDECLIYDVYRSFCNVRRKAHYSIINRMPYYLTQKDYTTGCIETEVSNCNMSLYNRILYDFTVKKHILFNNLIQIGWINSKNPDQRRLYKCNLFGDNFPITLSSAYPHRYHDAFKIDKDRKMKVYTFNLVRDSTRATTRRKFSEKYSRKIIDLSTQENRDQLVIETTNKINKIDSLLKEFEQIMRLNYTMEDIFVKDYNQEFLSKKNLTLSPSMIARLKQLRESNDNPSTNS